ncbi:hypothetical protein, partial [Paenibacillus cisolokensis]|uniref:hypothetical protein n=1 Tax=Paenibacillus cisolokensis TaxID=1658519 RepID=UPI001BCD5F8B
PYHRPNGVARRSNRDVSPYEWDILLHERGRIIARTAMLAARMAVQAPNDPFHRPNNRAATRMEPQLAERRR